MSSVQISTASSAPSQAAVAPSVSGLRVGQQVDGVFACTRKDRLTTRTGSSYLALELRDRTGTIAARAFREADRLAGLFERGELVHVSGRVDRFREELVLEVLDLRRIDPDAGDVDPTRFLPSAYRDLDELEGFLEHLAGEVYDRGYRTRFGADFGLTPEGRLLGHLVIGERMLSAACDQVGIDDERRLSLHCVLSHRGPSSAPGGRFALAEALALFRLNGVDASVMGAFERGLE
jgi:23S rRNA maturation-related 3'-5' exoribonuclease YhaM